MKKHYIRKEALVVADAVFEKIHGMNENGKGSATVTEKSPSPEITD
jgi:hypothetical protein